MKPKNDNHRANVERAYQAWTAAKDLEAQALADRGEAQRAKAQHASLERQGRYVAAELAWVKSQDQTREKARELDLALHAAELAAGNAHAAAVDLAALAADVGAAVDLAADLREQARLADARAAERLAAARASRETLAAERLAAGFTAPAPIPVPVAQIGGVNMAPGHQLLAIRAALSSPPSGPKNPEKIRHLESELRTIAHSIAVRDKEKAEADAKAEQDRKEREQDRKLREQASAREAEKARRELAAETAERAALEAEGMARLGLASKGAA